MVSCAHCRAEAPSHPQEISVGSESFGFCPAFHVAQGDTQTESHEEYLLRDY